MIPSFGPSGTLPPFVGNSPADGAGRSPYHASMLEVVASLGTTPARARLCRGLLELRRELRKIGIEVGVQWLNGSFCEDIETTRSRPPRDIDVVTLLARPEQHRTDEAWRAFVAGNSHLFENKQTKGAFGCDAYFIDLHSPADLTISQITYWFGLFTHQRMTHLWKGILQVPLQSDDDEAWELLASAETDSTS